MPGSVILLDIEGTSAPIQFVYDVLFPYARTHVKRLLSRTPWTDDLSAVINGLREEHLRDQRLGTDPPPLSLDSTRLIESVAGYFHWLMDQDRKAAPLKALQGLIWEEGYSSGELLSQVFADVPVAMARWRSQGRSVCIYSSGSAHAQKLFFKHTVAGDLTGYICGYFDTTAGAKKEAASYQRIASQLSVAPDEIVFVSDVVAELDAAKSAGLETRLCVRPGNPPQPAGSPHRIVQSFDELFPE